MPSALYAISFKKTGNLLAVASFEEESLADQTSRDALFKALIGDKWIADGAATGSQIVLKPNDLAIDELTPDVKVDDVLADLYSYGLDLSAVGTTPGDGKPKSLVKTTTYEIHSLKIDHTSRTVVVTMTTSEGPVPHDAYLLFEGSDPVKGGTTAGSPTVTLPIDASVTINTATHYRFMFVKNDAPVTFGFLQPV